jgi:hypothetical protein
MEGHHMHCRPRTRTWPRSRALVFAAAFPSACATSPGSSNSGTSDTAAASVDSFEQVVPPDTADTFEDTASIEFDGAAVDSVAFVEEVSKGDVAVDDVPGEAPDTLGGDTCDDLDCQPASGGAVCPPLAPFGVELGDTMPDLVLKTCDDGEVSLHSLCEKEAVWLFGYADW